MSAVLHFFHWHPSWKYVDYLFCYLFQTQFFILFPFHSLSPLSLSMSVSLSLHPYLSLLFFMLPLNIFIYSSTLSQLNFFPLLSLSLFYYNSFLLFLHHYLRRCQNLLLKCIQPSWQELIFVVKLQLIVSASNKRKFFIWISSVVNFFLPSHLHRR